MRTKLGTLTLNLVAKTSDFTGPIKNAEKQANSSFEGMGNKITAFSAIAVSAIAAAGAGAYAMAREYADVASELQTFAAISNTTVQEFQSLSTGAQTVGISTEKLADQFKDFNEKLGEFITIGTGGAVDFFEQIAIKTEGSAEGARNLALEMQNLSGPKALQLYVDKLEEAGVTQQQMSFYLENMASDTTNLIPLLKNGGEGFKFWADAAEKAGVIMDESAIQKSAELKVQLDLLDLQVAGVKNQFIQGLLPSLVSIGDAMTQGATDTNLMSEAGAVLGEVFKGVAVVGMGVYSVIKMLSNAISGLAADAIINKQKIEMAAENKGLFANLPGVKFFRTAMVTSVLANAKNSHTNQSIQENSKVADDYIKFINQVYSSATSEAIKSQAKLGQSQTGVIKGSDDWIRKQNEAARSSGALNRSLQAQNRLLQERNRNEEQRLRQSIESHYYSESEKLEYEHQIKLSEIQKAFAEDPSAIQKYTELQEKAYQKDVEAFKKAQMEKQYSAMNAQFSMQDKIIGLSTGTEDIFAKATMSPREYDKWSLENERSNAQVSLKQNRISVEQDIMTSNIYSSEDERYEDLVKAHQEYRDAMAAIDVKYKQQEQDLTNQNQAASLAGYGAMFGMMGSVLDAFGAKSSTAFKAMFLLHKSFVFSSALLNSKGAIMAAWNDPANVTFLQKMAAAAATVVQTNELMSAIQGVALAGIAHGGLDNVPREGTWLLDGGERVLSPQQNKDLTNYLANSGSGGDINFTQTIVIQSDGSVKSESQGEMKQLGSMIETAVVSVISRELRQGGLIKKAMSGG